MDLIKEVNVDELVAQINQIALEAQNQFGLQVVKIGQLVYENLKDLDYGAQKEVIKAIKDHPDVQLHPQYIWQSYNLVRKRPELMDASNHKVSITHYLELYKHNLTDQARALLEAKAETEKLSVRKLREEIQLLKAEARGIKESEFNEVKNLRGEIRRLINELEVEKLRAVKSFIIDIVPRED